MKKFSYAVILLLVATGVVCAQDAGQPLIKSEVLKAHIMFERQVWRRMDLKEKQNRPFFSRNGEVPRLLIQAVREGLIKSYMSDSCVNLMPDDVFEENVSIEKQNFDQFGGGGGGFDSFGGGGGFGGGFGDTQTTTEPAPEQDTKEYDPIPPEMFSILYLKEDVVFDRNRSRMIWYIRSLSVAIPQSAGPTWNPAGFEKKVAHFKYQDVVDLFRGPYAEQAIWFNNQNQAQHRNIGDALELRLFRAPITKISNADDLDIRQLTSDPFEAILMQQEYENDLMEYESELWEY